MTSENRNNSASDFNCEPITWATAPGGVMYPVISLVISSKDNGVDLVDWVPAVGLIDTGADHCVMPMETVRRLRPTLIRTGSVHTADGITPTSYYRIHLLFDRIPMVISTDCSAGSSGTFFGPFDFVVGRNILNFGTLTVSQLDKSQFCVPLQKSEQRL